MESLLTSRTQISSFRSSSRSRVPSYSRLSPSSTIAIVCGHSVLLIEVLHVDRKDEERCFGFCSLIVVRATPRVINSRTYLITAAKSELFSTSSLTLAKNFTTSARYGSTAALSGRQSFYGD